MAPRDPTTGAYNVGPRLFAPGINRFVGADSYVGAAANMGLALDPLTGNRYLYAGANPVDMIDDGHKPLHKKYEKTIKEQARAHGITATLLGVTINHEGSGRNALIEWNGGFRLAEVALA